MSCIDEDDHIIAIRLEVTYQLCKIVLAVVLSSDALEIILHAQHPRNASKFAVEIHQILCASRTNVAHVGVGNNDQVQGWCSISTSSS